MRYILFPICLFTMLSASAQDKDKKEKIPVFNYSTDDPMEAYNRINQSSTIYIYVPEFYSSSPSKIMDTTYSFECYDSRDSVITPIHIKDAKDVRFISEFKSYTDKEHTYIDADGSRKLMPVSSIIRRYDRVGEDKWMSIDYTTNQYIQLKETSTYVVRTDTVMVKVPNSDQEETVIYCYYKIERIK